MSKYLQVKVFELYTKVAGKGIALNYGVENSTGNYILVLTSDSLLTKDFIENMLPLMKIMQPHRKDMCLATGTSTL